MASPDENSFKSVKMSGTVGIERFTKGDEWEYPKSLILVMGPTGAGKSSFIEALAGPNSTLSKLSSGGLDGYTQDVFAYKVQGIKEARSSTIEFTVYLIDTPGFADDKISAHEIVSKIKDYLGSAGFVPYIFFFTPITSTRLPGSHRRVVKAFKSLTGTSASGGLTIVTTMWDTLWSQSAKSRAENNFNQLNGDIWKEYTEQATQITRFYNTRASALQVLDFAFQRYRNAKFAVEGTISESGDDYIHPSNAIFFQDICADLTDRIQSLTMKKEVIASDIAEISASGNEELKGTLESELSEVDTILTKFERQLAYLLENRSPITLPREPLDSGDADPPLPSPDNIIPFASQVTVPLKGRMNRLKESTKRLVNTIARRDGH